MRRGRNFVFVFVLVTVVVDQVAQERRQEHGTQAAARYGHSVGEPAVLDEVRCHNEYAGRERQTRTAAEHHSVTETRNDPLPLPK